MLAAQRDSRDRIVVRTLRCGRSNPGSNPGHGKGAQLDLFGEIPVCVQASALLALTQSGGHGPMSLLVSPGMTRFGFWQRPFSTQLYHSEPIGFG